VDRLYLSLFPALLGGLLVIPGTLVRGVYVLANQVEQTLKEKVILYAGILISCLYGLAFIDLVLTLNGAQ